MTVAVVRPADPLERRRFDARLALIPEAQRAAIAARTGNPTKIDADDLEPSKIGMRPLVSEASETYASRRLATDIGLISIATAVLRKPNVTESEFRNAIRGLATGVSNANSTAGVDDIASSDRAQFAAYRDAITQFESAVFSSHLSITLDNDVAVQDAEWLRTSLATIRAQRGETPLASPIRLSNEFGAYDYVVPFTNFVLWHVDGKRTLSLGR